MYDYTISSTDYEHNSTIHVNLTNPQTEFCKMTITSLTTTANIVVLNKDDYLTMNNVRYDMTDEYSEISAASLCEYLNTIIDSHNAGYGFTYDNCNRILIVSNHQFSFNDCSYNMRLLLGLVNVTLPLSSVQITNESYKLVFPDVGMFLSTPVLYLASNLGSNSYKIANGTTSMRILMRITNSFFAKQPIIATNGDYTTTIRSSDLSDVRFTLLDANYHEIKLLNPMYLTVQIESIPDIPEKEIDLSRGPIDPSEIISMTPYAYMHDLTERGKEVDDSQIQNLVFINQPNEQSS